MGGPRRSTDRRWTAALFAITAALALVACPRGDGGTAVESDGAGRTEDEAVEGESLPEGKYLCYLVPSYNYTGFFTIVEDRRYEPFQGSGGPYAYDAGTMEVEWVEGAYESAGWVGVFLPEGFEDRETPTVVIKNLGDGRPPGEEGPNEFQYCYIEE